MKVPKVTIDRKALKKGIWSNTWKEWGWISLAFLVLYGIEAGYFTGLLFASKRIRGTSSFRTLPVQYFGEFERNAVPHLTPVAAVGAQMYFNTPKGCVAQTEDFIVDGQTFQRETGEFVCTSTNSNNLAWVQFPWVAATSSLPGQTGCKTSGGSTVLTNVNPSIITDPAVACQNFAIVAGAAEPALAPSSA